MLSQASRTKTTRFRVGNQKSTLPPKVCAPTNISKYDGSMNPDVWLEDYRLACCMVRIKDDYLIILFISIHLAEGARAWLEHLPVEIVHDWANLWKAFIENFEGTYKRPRSSCDLKRY